MMERSSIAVPPLVAIVFALLLSGCVSAVKLDSGERMIGSRLVFHLEGAWNQINAPGLGATQVWTMEGLPIDQLLVYAGIKEGDELSANSLVGNAAGASPKNARFRADMRPDELAGLFEGMLTRDGSVFKLARLEPYSFGGGKGFRFEYNLVRKIDNAQLQGLGYGVVDKGELFALLYVAPRLTFFPRHQSRVEQMAKTARLKI